MVIQLYNTMNFLLGICSEYFCTSKWFIDINNLKRRRSLCINMDNGPLYTANTRIKVVHLARNITKTKRNIKKKLSQTAFYSYGLVTKKWSTSLAKSFRFLHKLTCTQTYNIIFSSKRQDCLSVNLDGRMHIERLKQSWPNV